MGDCCNKEPESKGATNSGGAGHNSCHPQKQRPDYLLWISATIVLICYVLYWLVDGHPDLPQWLVVMTSGVFELINRMWWG
ncbi:MAG: hypothetical protein V7725_04600, partial [Porticoccus sp.]